MGAPDNQSANATRSLLLTMVAVASLAALMSALITKSWFGMSCADSAALRFPQKEPEWDMVNKLDVPEKGIRVTRLMSNDRCYIMPKRTSEQQANRAEGRPLAVIDDALSADMVEHVAGAEAAAFCRGYTTYVLKDISEDLIEPARSKRESYPAAASGGAPPPPISAPPVAVPAVAPGQAAKAAPTAAVAPAAAPATPAVAPAAAPASPAVAPAGAPVTPAGAAAAVAAAPAESAADLAAKVPELVGKRIEGSGIFGGAALPGKGAAQIPLEQRQPRCHKIVLDCPNMVGQVQSCFTWQNGRIWMDRQCKDPNTFVIRMTKPPGRILKVAQQESILCLQLHRQNKDC